MNGASRRVLMNDQGRGIVLTVWLGLLIGGAAAASVMLFAAFDEAAGYVASGWALLTLGGLALGKAAAGGVVMLGKRGGFWLNLVATAAALVVSLADGMRVYLGILFLVDPTVLYLLMRPTWD